MKKAVFALLIAYAGALAFADSAQWRSNWFTGIGSNATALDSLDASNGTWATFPTGVSFDVDTKTITFELDDEDESAFTVNADSAATEKTAQKIVVKGVFTPCTASDLSTGAEMNADKAQLGFAVVGPIEVTSSENDSETTTVYKYYAWLGSATTEEGSSPIDDWTEIGTCADPEQTTELTITISYWNGEPKAKFSAVNGSSDAVTSEPAWLTSKVVTGDDAVYKVSSVVCTGSGTISALNGETGIAVASVGDVQYGTAADAIEAAASSTQSPTVKLLAAPDGSVAVGEGKAVSIDENGHSATIKNSGTLTVALSADNVKAGNGDYTFKGISGNGTFKASTSDLTKTATCEVKDGNLVVTVDTAAAQVEAIKILTKNLMKSEDLTGFRTFLKTNCKDVYNGAESTTAKLTEALGENGDNTLPLWQSYVLGIESGTSVAVNYASADSETDKVSLSIPALANKAAFGSYTVKITDGNSTTLSAGGEGSPLSTLKLPMESAAKYAVTLSFE